MTVIAIKKTAWQNANDTQRTILRWGMNKVDLGSGAEYEQPDLTRWFIFSDWRITLNDVARLGTLVKGLATFPNYTFPMKDVIVDGVVVGEVVDKAATKADVFTWVQANWVDPATLTIPIGEDAFTFVLAAQTPPLRFRRAVRCLTGGLRWRLLYDHFG